MYVGFKKNVNRATTQVMMKTGTHYLTRRTRVYLLHVLN